MKLFLCFVVGTLGLCCSFASAEEESSVSFRRDIAPILLDSCFACHGPKKAEGGYRVDTFNELLKAGDSGELPVAASAEEVSELLRRITCEDEFERMPAESDPLSPEQIALFRQWIAAGGKFDGDHPDQSLALLIPSMQYADPPEVYSQAVPITATTFSPNGKRIVTGGYHELVVWSAEDAKLARRIQNVGQRVFALAFSPDGETLAVACGEPGRRGEVRLIDFASGEIKSVIARTTDVVLDVAYRPGAPELAVASADNTIRIFNVETFQQVRSIASHADWVTAVAWSDDGSRLVSASRDKSAKAYDAATGALLASYLGHGSTVRGVSLLADNQQVVSVGADNKLHRWNIEGAKKVAEVGIGGEGYKLIRHGTDLYVPCSSKRVVRIDLNSNKVVQEYVGHGDWVLSASYQPASEDDGNQSLLAGGAFNGEVCIWNARDAGLVHQWIAKP